MGKGPRKWTRATKLGLVAVTLLCLMVASAGILAVVSPNVLWCAAASTFEGTYLGSARFSPNSTRFVYLRTKMWIAPLPHGPIVRSITWVCWVDVPGAVNRHCVQVDDFRPPGPYEGDLPADSMEQVFSPDGTVLAVKIRDRCMTIDTESGCVIKESGAEAEFEEYKTAGRSNVELPELISPDGRFAARDVGHGIEFFRIGP